MRTNDPDELLALITLPDGRKAWRDSHGRHRDKITGQWISARILAEIKAIEPPAPILATRSPQPLPEPLPQPGSTASARQFSYVSATAPQPVENEGKSPETLNTPQPFVLPKSLPQANSAHPSSPAPMRPNSSARDRARWHLHEAVRLAGLDPMTVEDAWGRLVGVQARIALDESGGTRATAAAKLVAQATGLMDTVKSETDADQPIRIEMTVEDALAFMDLIGELDQPEDPVPPAASEDRA